MNLNKIIMMGNLTRDPESKQFSNSSVCKFGIAVNRKSKTTDEVCFVDVIAWGQLAEVCQKYLVKGKPVLVEGRLKLEQWEKDGKQNSRHVIILENMQMISEPKNVTIEGQQEIPKKKKSFEYNNLNNNRIDEDHNTAKPDLDDLPF